ncbi:antiviral innate immune response receptor RIG-I-like isoform X2 [Lineus longissimus]|uniref:antiviral innate immune response receptor RIG-I-like isoform X2 n=1 Tax=Lineus longissimus TaxID=88925 RepID=UPI00315D8E04
MNSEKERYFENLLQIYRHKIEELLNPRDIVPYLPDWNPEILLISNSKKFLKELQDKLREDDAHRVFIEFLDALKAAGCTPLFKLLSGDSCHEYDKFKRLLRVLHAYIKDRIVIDVPLLLALRARDVISEEEKKEIQELVDSGRHDIEATYALIRALPRRNEKWPALVIEALGETGNDSVIEVLLTGGELNEEEGIEIADQDNLLRKLGDMAPEVERTNQGNHQVDNLHRRGSKDTEMAIKMPVNDLNSGTANKINNTMPDNGLNNSPCEGAVGGVSASPTPPLNIGFQSYPYHEEENLGAAASGTGRAAGLEEKAVEELGDKLRSYQTELARPGLEGKNAIVCAPTGSGKTYVALAIAKNHLEQAREKDRPCVIYAVDKVNLIQQQLDGFKPYLPECYNPHGMSGKQSESLSYIMSISKVIVLTAQVLLNALETESIHNADVLKISDVSLLIFDECQNTTKKHPYNAIMKHYLEAKLGDGPKVRLPQIIGLTASLGVGGAGSTDGAIDHVEKMCANLDATELCLVKENIKELIKHVAAPGVELKSVPIRGNDPCKTMVCQHMEEIHRRIKEQPELNVSSIEVNAAILAAHFKELPSDFGSLVYTGWVSRLLKIVPSINDNCLRMRSITYASYLKMYHEALNRNAQARIKDALVYLAEEMEESKRPNGDEVSGWLKKRYEEIDMQLRPIMDAPEYENPLLQLLQDKILSYSANSAESLGIIFVQTRAATGMLHAWMVENQQLSSFKPAIIMGTHEMTQAKQVDILEKFRKGEHRCLIATSVAEAGLDIQMCNWVIKYNHTTNEIALVQAKGRARQLDSRYAVVATEGSGKVRKEQINQVREIMMNSAALEVSQMPRDVLKERILKIQEAELAKHRREAEDLRKRPFVTDEYDLLCKACRVFVTNSADLRVRNKTQHTTIQDGFKDLYVKEPAKKLITVADFISKYDIFCSAEKCKKKWGKLATVLGIEIPVLSPENFAFMLKTSGQCCTDITRWKNFPYTIPEY